MTNLLRTLNEITEVKRCELKYLFSRQDVFRNTLSAHSISQNTSNKYNNKQFSHKMKFNTNCIKSLMGILREPG
jgi:hypothetical protein